MGTSFSTIALKATPNALARALKSVLKAQGYRSDVRKGKICLRIHSDPNGWCSVHGELLAQPDNLLEPLAEQLSLQMKRPVLTAICMDSDALFLILNRGAETETVHAGSWEEPSAEPTPEFWGDCVQDMPAFAAALHKDYVFAEEALEPLSACFGFAPQQLCFPAEEGLLLRFSPIQEKIPTYLASGPTQLCSPLLIASNAPCLVNLPNHQGNVLHALNTGGPSVGLDLYITGDPLERHNPRITVVDLSLRLGDDFFAPASIETITLPDGQAALHYSYPDLPIPKGLNPTWTESQAPNYHHIEHNCSLALRYQLDGPEDPQQLNFHFVPREYPEGSFTWRLSNCDCTPAEYRELLENMHDQNCREAFLQKHPRRRQ